MPDVITWSLAGGTIVFVIGLISAITSRRQRKSRQEAEKFAREEFVARARREDTKPTGAMSMAASGGARNGEESFASVGNSSR